MNIHDDYYPLQNDYLKLAEQVEIIQKAGNCSENTAALVVLATQLSDISNHINHLTCTVSEWEAEWEVQNDIL